MRGYKFLRQRPMDDYIVDFFCPELMLAIEIDGSTHVGKENYDKKRQERLEGLEIHFLRFYDSDIKINIEGVLEKIGGWIDANAPR